MNEMGEVVESPPSTLLVIDDNPSNLSVLVNYLAEHGFHVMVARDGEMGLRLAQLHSPDLIILDVFLPGIDGFEVCRRVKADERIQDIPVLFMTVATRTEDKLRGFEAGGVDFITKPFHHQEVLVRVTTHLRSRRLTRELEAAKEDLERRVTERTAELTRANTKLEEEIAERRRAEEVDRRVRERDHRIAAVLQQGLRPSVPTRIGPVQVAACYQPASAGHVLGGDWYDAFALPGGRIGITVGDVAGHGIECAALMTGLRYAAHVLATNGAGPVDVIRGLNQIMLEHGHPGDIEIATVVHAQLDTATGRLAYCNAGHLPLIALAPPPATHDVPGTCPAQARPLPGIGGLPLGVRSEVDHREQHTDLGPRWALIGFTDGLIERRGEDIEQALNDLLAGLRTLPATTQANPQAITAAVLGLAPSGNHTDDTAVIVLTAEGLDHNPDQATNPAAC
jgi:DNA-binding response OmpR family regulator